MTTLCCLGGNFRTIPLPLRERFAWGPIEHDYLLQRAASSPGIQEGLLLVTCNRTELYAVGADAEATQAALKRVLCDHDRVAAATLWEQGYRFGGATAIRHLFRVAASLDAMVVGESQILGQVKAAYRAACAVGTVGPLLHRVVQQALACAKRVRQTTEIGQRPVSVASIAVALAEQIVGEIPERKALVVGLGEMGQQVVRQLKGAGIRTLFVTTRTEAKGRAMAAEWGATALPWTALAEGVSQVDIVVAAAGVRTPIFSAALVQEAMRDRCARPLFLLDIAVPRNVAEGVDRLPEVYLYNIDDLQALATENRLQRESQVALAETMVTQAADVCSADITRRMQRGWLQKPALATG